MSEMRSALSRVNRVPGVRGSMVVAAQDGIIIDSDLMIGVPGERVAALVASLFQRAGRSVSAAALGDVRFLQVRAKKGYFFAAAPPADDSDLLFVVIADRSVNVARARLETTRAVKAAVGP